MAVGGEPLHGGGIVGIGIGFCIVYYIILRLLGLVWCLSVILLWVGCDGLWYLFKMLVSADLLAILLGLYVCYVGFVFVIYSFIYFIYSWLLRYCCYVLVLGLMLMCLCCYINLMLCVVMNFGLLLVVCRSWWIVILCVIVDKMPYLIFLFWCVGRGVLRFWEGWYRKTRSKLCGICDFWGISGKLGVDII